MQLLIGIALIVLAVAFAPLALSNLWEYSYWLAGAFFLLLITKGFLDEYQEHEGSFLSYLWKGKQTSPKSDPEAEARRSLEEQQKRLKDELGL